MLFLKILDERDRELEIVRDDYVSVIPEEFQWRNWAADPEGLTGDELLNFINHPTDGLFPNRTNLQSTKAPQRAGIVREVFDGVNNYMKSGSAMRKVINQLNGFDFNNSEDRQIFGTIYEDILRELRDAGNKGEFYTPRAITQLMTQMTNPTLGETVLDPAAGTGGFAAILQTKVYFAHPYASWERGTNKNTNGLIRQYLPKGMSFRNQDMALCKEIERKLNMRPRKRLSFAAPMDYRNKLIA